MISIQSIKKSISGSDKYSKSKLGKKKRAPPYEG